MSKRAQKQLPFSFNRPILSNPLLRGLGKMLLVWGLVLLLLFAWRCLFIISPDDPRGEVEGPGVYNPEKVDEQLKKLSEFSIVKAAFSTNLRDKGGMIVSSPAMVALRKSFQEEYKSLGTVRLQAVGGCYYWIVYQSSDEYVIIAEPKSDLLRNKISNVKWRFIPGHHDKVKPLVLDDQRSKTCASILEQYEKNHKNVEKAILELFSKDFICAPPSSIDDIVITAYVRIANKDAREKKFGSLTPSSKALTEWLNEGRDKVDQYEWSLYYDNNETFYLLCSKEGECKALYDGDVYEDDCTRIVQQLAACQSIEDGKAWEYWALKVGPITERNKGEQETKSDTTGQGHNGDNLPEVPPPKPEVLIGAIVKDAYQTVTDSTRRQARFGDKTPTANDLTSWLNTEMNTKEYTWTLYYDVNDNICLLCSKNNELIAFYNGGKVFLEKDLSKVLELCDEVQPNKTWGYWKKEEIVPPQPLQIIVEDAYLRLDTVAEREKKFGSLTPSSKALTEWLNEGRDKVDQYEWSLYHDNNETFYLLCSKEGECKALYDGDEYVDVRLRIIQQLAACQSIEDGKAWEYWGE